MYSAVQTCMISRSPLYITAHQLCSLVADDREGRQALKKEQWDISMYSKLSREVGNQFDFEPRSTAKEARGVRRGSKRRSSDRKKGSSKESKKSSSGKKSSVSVLACSGV